MSNPIGTKPVTPTGAQPANPAGNQPDSGSPPGTSQEPDKSRPTELPQYHGHQYMPATSMYLPSPQQQQQQWLPYQPAPQAGTSSGQGRQTSSKPGSTKKSQKDSLSRSQKQTPDRRKSSDGTKKAKTPTQRSKSEMNLSRSMPRPSSAEKLRKTTAKECKTPKAEEKKVETTIQKVSAKEEVKDVEKNVLLKGINPSTSEDCLVNFFEVATSAVPGKVIFNRNHSEALVEMTGEVDLEQVRKRLGRGLEGRFPQAYLVPTTHRLAVSSEPEINNIENLGLYFESKRHGGGDLETEDVDEAEDGSCYIFTFRDSKVVRSLCNREQPHRFEGINLRVSPYYSCEEGAIWDASLHVMSVPEPVTIQVQPEYAKYFSRGYSQDITQYMKQKHASIEFIEDSVVLNCELMTSHEQHLKQKMKTWSEDVTKSFKTFLQDRVTMKNFTVQLHVWRLLREYCNSDEFKSSTVLLELREETLVITLIGEKKDVKNMYEELERKQVEIDKKVRRKTVTEDLECSKKTRLFLDMPEYDQLGGKYPEVSIFFGDSEVTIEGLPEEIDEILTQIREAMNSIRMYNLDLRYSAKFLQFICDKENISNAICNGMKESNVRAEWEVLENKIVAYMNENADDRRVLQVFKDCLGEECVDLTKDDQYTVNSQDWSDFRKEEEGQYENQLQIDNSKVYAERHLKVYGLAQPVRFMVQKICTFLKENRRCDIVVECSSVVIEYISKYKQAWMMQFKQQYTNSRVDLFQGEEKIVLKIKAKEKHQAEENVHKMKDEIKHETFIYKAVAVVTIYEKALKSRDIATIENNNRCLIKKETTHSASGSYDLSRDDYDKEQFKDHLYENTFMGKRKIYDKITVAPPAFYTAKNGVTVELVIGEPGEIPCEILVVAISPDLDLNCDPVCKSLLEKGGKEFQDNCKADYPSGIKVGEVATVFAEGGVECQKVCLVTLPSWADSGRQNLHKVMTKCMQLAVDEDKYNIMFVAMGTMSPKYPSDQVASAMYQEVADFDSLHTNTSLKEVKIVFNKDDTEYLKAFRKEEQARITGTSTVNKQNERQNLSGFQQTFRANNGIEVSMLKGELGDQEANVLLALTPCDLDLTADPVCQSLTRVGGDKLHKRCRKNYPEGIREGEVACLPATGSLECKCVYFVALPSREPSGKQVLQNAFIKSMEEAAKADMESMIICPVTPPSKKYPPQDMAAVAFQAVVDFDTKYPITTLKWVKYVMPVTETDLISAFEKELGHRISGTSGLSSGNPVDSGPSATSSAGQAIPIVEQTRVLMQIENDQPVAEVDQHARKLAALGLLTLTIYGDNIENIRKCDRDIKTCIENQSILRKIGGYEKVVKMLTAKQLDEIKTVGLVEVTLEKKEGKIRLYGPKEKVSEANDVIRRKLRVWEQVSKSEENANLQYNQVKWHCEDASGNISVYDPMTSYLLEMGQKNEEEIVRLLDPADGQIYTINLLDMIEHPEGDRVNFKSVFRKEISRVGQFEFPPYWDTMDEKEDEKFVQLSATDSEYKKTEQKFVSEVQKGKMSDRLPFDKNAVKVTQIVRIQSKPQFQQYCLRKKVVEKNHLRPTNMPLEQQLWHATKQENVSAIQANGFNRSEMFDQKPKKNQSPTPSTTTDSGLKTYGKGTHFSHCASYGIRAWEKMDAKPYTGHIFLAKVLTGYYCQGKSDMKYTEIIKAEHPSIKYDSAVDDVNNPEEFVIFQDNQAYPEYHVTFTA